MSAHPTELLALAAAAALDPEEEERVARHLEQCAECAAAVEPWHRLGQELRRLPSGKTSPALVARTVRSVELLLAERTERAWNRAALGFVVAFAWTIAVVSWLLFDLVTNGLALTLGRPVGSTVAWYGVYLVVGWLSAGAAAVLLGRRTQEEGRLA